MQAEVGVILSKGRRERKSSGRGFRGGYWGLEVEVEGTLRYVWVYRVRCSEYEVLEGVLQGLEGLAFRSM